MLTSERQRIVEGQHLSAGAKEKQSTNKRTESIRNKRSSRLIRGQDHSETCGQEEGTCDCCGSIRSALDLCRDKVRNAEKWVLLAVVNVQQPSRSTQCVRNTGSSKQWQGKSQPSYTSARSAQNEDHECGPQQRLCTLPGKPNKV